MFSTEGCTFILLLLSFIIVRLIKMERQRTGTKTDTLEFLQCTLFAKVLRSSRPYSTPQWYFLVPLHPYYFSSITLTRILFRFRPCKFHWLILIPLSHIPSPNPLALQSHSSFIASLSHSLLYNLL